MGKKNKKDLEKKEHHKTPEPKTSEPKKEPEIEKPEAIIEKNNGKEEEKEPETINPNLLQEKYTKSLEQIKKNLLPLLSDSQILKALDSLTLYKKSLQKSTAPNILDSNLEDFIYLDIIFNKYPLRYSSATCPISIPNSIYHSKFSSSVCLFVKDPRQAFKDLNIEFPFEIKVIDIEKLKQKYPQYKNKRELAKKYDIFICDNRIKFALNKLLGKPFYVSKKLPHPLDMDYEKKDEIKNDIKKIVEKMTIFHMNNGPVFNAKFGRFSMTKEENKENFKESVMQVVANILKYDIDLDELRSISIKGNNTISLPVYSHLKESELKTYTGNI